MKEIIKRIFCKHQFKEEYKISGKNSETQKWEELEIGYQCQKCGKMVELEIYVER